MPAANHDALTIRQALTDDIGILAALNRQLLEDEGHRSQFSNDRLMERHRGWMESGEWRQDVLELAGTVVGYVAYASATDAPDPVRPDIHVRQFCIDRAHRGGGLGRAGFRLFLRERVPAGTRVTLDVLESNPAGLAFWRAVGCMPYFTRMEIAV